MTDFQLEVSSSVDIAGTLALMVLGLVMMWRLR
mgnify:CR=1 FL=1